MFQFSAPSIRLRLNHDGSGPCGERGKRQIEACDSVAARPPYVDLRLEGCAYHFYRDYRFRFRVCSVRDLDSQPYALSGNESAWSNHLEIKLSLFGASLQVIRYHLIEVEPGQI